jgi:23S rRNA (uracil1939-C5)-methyltransferase
MASTVTIEKLVYGGEGLGHVSGEVVLTPFVLPGEQVALNAAHAKKGVLRGSDPAVLEPSKHRVQPRCEYFGRCGGCHYQHAEYEYELTQKTEILRETLRRLGGIHYEQEIPAVSGDPWFYRNRIQLHFADGEMGFRRQASHDLCAIDHCYISAPLLVEAIRRLRDAVKRPEWPGFVRSLELFTNGSDLQLNILDSARPVAARFFDWCATFLPSLAPGAIEYQAGGFRFRVSGRSFFQINRFLIDSLLEEVLSDSHGARAVDLYAGVGLFSLGLTKRFDRVDGVERGLSAYLDLESNAKQSGANIQASRGSAEEYASRQSQEAPDLLVADPPRTGLGNAAIQAILQLNPHRMTLVSCDPATLARDARKLLTAYRVRRLALVDLFPHTYHFETVMHLERIT